MGNISETAKNKFLLPLQKNDVPSVYQHFHPELKAKFELPLLVQFVRAINEALGPFVIVKRQSDKAAGSYVVEGKTKAQSGELEFAHGSLEFSVTFGPEDVIMAFFLYSAKTPTAFVKEIETASYVARSQAVIQSFYAGDASGVFPHFHVALRGVVGEDDLRQMITKETNRAELGKFITVTPENIPEVASTSENKQGISQLVLNFKIEREFATGRGTITWVFQSPMKGEIIAFEFCSTILSVKKDTLPGDGLKLASEALNQIVNFDTDKFVANMHISLKAIIDPSVLRMQFKRFFSNGGPMTETIEESLKKATETIETMSNSMKSVKVNGRLTYEKFNMLYAFSFVSGILIQFNVKPDTTTHVVEEDPAAVKEELIVKTKTFLHGLIIPSKLQEAKDLVDASLVDELNSAHKHLSGQFRSVSVDQIKFDITMGAKNDSNICRAQVSFTAGTTDTTFTCYVDWKLNPLKYSVVGWDFKSGKELEREKQEAARKLLWTALIKNGLRVFVEKATNLAAADSNGFSDPYVVLSIFDSAMNKRTEKTKTKVIKKNLNPVWNEMLVLTKTCYVASEVIKVEVWDKDKITDDFLGQIHWTFDEVLSHVIEKGEVTVPYALKDKKDGNKAQGEVYLKFVFNSQ